MKKEKYFVLSPSLYLLNILKRTVLYLNEKRRKKNIAKIRAVSGWTSASTGKMRLRRRGGVAYYYLVLGMGSRKLRSVVKARSWDWNIAAN
jgi:hypothetical protein